jgi:hypothetical protein
MGRAAREAALRYEWETVLGHMNQYYDEILRPAVFSGDGASVPEPTL